jgi:hypothetical protein
MRFFFFELIWVPTRKTGRVIGQEQALRTRLDMLLMHCMMLRSETTRAAELSDFETTLLMKDAFAVVMRQRGGKTKDRSLCFHLR